MNNNKKPKLAVNMPKPKKLSKKEMKEVLEEVWQNNNLKNTAFESEALPGDYYIKEHCLRGQKTETTCTVCNGNIEKLYIKKTPYNPNPVFGPGSGIKPKACWAASGYRCSSCKLVYDLR